MLYLNGQPLNVTVFPDKTSQVWKLPESLFSFENHESGRVDINKTKIRIEWRFDSEAEFLQLAQLKDLFDSKDLYPILTITYLPYGRQDKEVSNTATFALRTFAKLLNSLNFKKIVIHDPHSKIATDLINNSVAKYPIKQVEEAAQSIDKNGAFTIFCYPDKGAVSKYTKIYDLSYRPHIYGKKVRDQLTGNILSYKVIGDPASKNVLIVDDICDGGMTFKLLAKDLLAAGAKSVSLFVTHGIFSKGVRVLFDSGISRVFTEDGEVSKHAK